MEHDIAIGMAVQPRRRVDHDAAQTQAHVRAKAVRVLAQANAHVARARLARGGDGAHEVEVRRLSDLQVARLARDRGDSDAAAFEQRRLVRVARGARRCKGIDEQLAAGALRRLRPDEAGSIDRLPETAAFGAL